MTKLKTDLKIPLSRGLGPALVGTEQWNIAKSKVTAAKEFSARIKEEQRNKHVALNRTLEHNSSSLDRKAPTIMQERVREFQKTIPRPAKPSQFVIKHH